MNADLQATLLRITSPVLLVTRYGAYFEIAWFPSLVIYRLGIILPTGALDTKLVHKMSEKDVEFHPSQAFAKTDAST